MQIARLDELQTGIKIAGRNNNLRYADDGGKQRGTKEPLDESERGELKSWLKAQHSENEDHGIQACHTTANTGEKRGSSGRFYFLGLQNHRRRWLQS